MPGPYIPPNLHLRDLFLSSINRVFFFFFALLGLNPQHMKVPRLRVESELRQSHSNVEFEPCLRLHHSSQQRQILNPVSEVRDRTHVLMDPSQVC